MDKIFSDFEEEFKKAILIREVEKKLLSLFNEGKISGTVHTCIGQEFTGVFISKYLESQDYTVSNHRGHGHYLSRFDDLDGLFGELMGKSSGCSNGIGGSQHMVNKNFLSNGIQGGMVPNACGIALFNKRNNNYISVAYIGDGTLGEGIIYETFNIASKWSLPLLVVLENNGIAQSTSINQNFSGNIEKRVKGFGLKYFEANTNNLYGLDDSCREAVSYVRSNKKPALININTQRLKSHSKGDDNRSADLIAELVSMDLLSQVYDSCENYYFQKYISEIQKKILEKAKKAESQNDSEEINIKYDSPLLDLRKISDPQNSSISKNRYNTSINEALDKCISQNPNLILIGEDIEDSNQFNPGAYGGAFKVTKGLSIKYPDNVLNTPISEAAITGISAGYCLAGGRAILEIMFGDFTTLILDQILQHVSKFEIIYGGKVKCPLIIRTPMGGRRGYGPTHSQSIEKHFLGIPNFGVVALNHRINPNYIFEAIHSLDSMPFMIIENKILYTQQLSDKIVPGYQYNFGDNLFPDLIIRPPQLKSSVTIICYGGNLIEVEKALLTLAVEYEIFVEVICVSILSHIDINEISKSVSQTSNLLIVEEGASFCSWGSEVVTKLLENDCCPKKIKRLSNNFVIPAAKELESKILPNENHIVNEVTKLFQC